VLSATGRGGEAVMDRLIVAVAIGMALVFGTGVLVGVIAMVSMAIHGRPARPERTDQ